jgi:hypothetical protein
VHDLSGDLAAPGQAPEHAHHRGELAVVDVERIVASTGHTGRVHEDVDPAESVEDGIDRRCDGGGVARSATKVAASPPARWRGRCPTRRR